MPPPPGQIQLEALVQSNGGRMKALNADQAGRPESLLGLSVKPTSLVTCTRCAQHGLELPRR